MSLCTQYYSAILVTNDDKRHLHSVKTIVLDEPDCIGYKGGTAGGRCYEVEVT